MNQKGTQIRYPTGYPWVKCDIRILETREISYLLKRTGLGGFTVYFALAMMFANTDGCLAYVEYDSENGNPLKGYSIGAFANNFIVDERLLLRLEKYGINNTDECKRIIKELISDDIHLLYKRCDGLWAITGLTSDINGPELHIDDSINYKGLAADGTYIPLMLADRSHTVDLQLPGVEEKLSICEPIEQIGPVEGKSISELASLADKSKDATFKWISRNDMKKYFIQQSTTKVLPDIMVCDFVTCLKKKMSVQDFHDKWETHIIQNQSRYRHLPYKCKKNKVDIVDISDTKVDIKLDIFNSKLDIEEIGSKVDTKVDIVDISDTKVDILKNNNDLSFFNNGINKLNYDTSCVATKSGSKVDIVDIDIGHQSGHSGHEKKSKVDIVDIDIGHQSGHSGHFGVQSGHKSDIIKSSKPSINKRKSDIFESVEKNSSKNKRIKEYKNINDDDIKAQAQKNFKAQVQYDIIKKRLEVEYHELLDAIVDACTEIMSSDTSVTRINSNTELKTEDLKKIISRMSCIDLMNDLDRIASIDTDISDVKRYFLTMVYKNNKVKRNVKKNDGKLREVPMPAYWDNRDKVSAETISPERLISLQKIQEEMDQ